MSDVVLVAVTLLFIILASFDWYVAVRFVVIALERPRFVFLTFAAVRSVAISVAGTVFAILGIASVASLELSISILPPPWGTVLLIVGAVVASVANLYALRVLRPEEP